MSPGTQRASSRARPSPTAIAACALGVPPQPLTVLVPCKHPGNGRIGSCLNGPAGQPIDPYRKLASDWALRYQLDIGATDPQDQTVYPIDLPVTISNDDVRDVDLGNGAVLDLAQAQGRQPATAAGMPPTTSPTIRSSARCRPTSPCAAKSLEDGSMICGLKPGTTSPAEGFTLAAIQFCESLRSIPSCATAARPWAACRAPAAVQSQASSRRSQRRAAAHHRLPADPRRPQGQGAQADQRVTQTTSTHWRD